MAEPGRDVPIVDYLCLDGGGAHLRAQRCAECGARYVGRRNGCGCCGGAAFDTVRLADTGEIRSATRIHRSAPGIEVPYVSIVVDLDGGGAVKATYLGDHDRPIEGMLGQRVRLVTRVAATDTAGDRAITFGYVDEEAP